VRILTVNCGSSSLKFNVLDVADEIAGCGRVASGEVNRIGHQSRSALEVNGARIERDERIADHAQAFRVAVRMLEESGHGDAIDAIGHRVVHGGGRFRDPVRIDEDVIREIEAASDLAPLHNGPALSAIRSSATEMGALPMVATFDTAYYADLPEVAASYALPYELSERFGIRRFGFHGLAHRYMVERFRSLRPEVQGPRIITLQLGNGCSATASVDGRPFDTSMGFTPLEGLIMGTRSGDIDPSLPLYLARQDGLSAEAVERLLNEDSGLLGLSGRSNDMRDLLEAEAAGDARAGLAVEAFCYRVKKFVGAYLAALDGADAVVFGGGIGEHSGEVRRRVCSGLQWAGLALDSDANSSDARGDRRISADDSKIDTWVIAVDEACVIARDTALALRQDGSS
jgi:acetate kinase